ncbi:MAG: acetate kinase [Hydrogenovibrio sp.]|uniref:acetate/propionate family kinase n=1 Tax=Hydrogenovibrio sp. TaxID=2065821 RepID=UPI00286FFD1C|nr:acetate kinase [Hydrogenovibrio sp.]MDR9498283.1 acetate kinase [Hydrogenovibrio sp.]
MKILVLNAGSSSLKYSLFQGDDSHLVAHGVIEQLAEHSERDHAWALAQTEAALIEQGYIRELGDCEAVGHRVVHGGERFQAPARITAEVLDAIKTLCELAPLHNPANLAPIQHIWTHYPRLPQVAVFDTAFHQSLPAYAYHYAIPQYFYDAHHIRRYGFHGTSHEYIAQRTASLMQVPRNQSHLISMHLGNGASVCAIEYGHSIDTSMGFTPLEGLIMGTRSGDLDPAIVLYLINHLSYDPKELDTLLNKQSGLKGLVGHNDMRQLLDMADAGDTQAHLAIEMFVYRLVKTVGGYLAIMDNLEALVFTGGIGEHAAQIRERVIGRFPAHFGLKLDPVANRNVAGETRISAADSRIQIWVIPTDEEWQIAQHTLAQLETK